MGERNIHVLSENPYNAEPDITELIKHPITPLSLVYSRNHGKMKDLEKDQSSGVDSYRLKIDGEIDGLKETSFTIKDLIVYFPRQDVTAVMNCAGNRRAKMAEKTDRDVEGLKWGEATVANIAWAGVPLRTILLHVGVPARPCYEDLHVCFLSHTTCEEDSYYGASIPMDKAMDAKGDVLLAYEMNDEPLMSEHGFPLRVVVPGYTGTRWVKWVDHITISHRESSNFYQQRDYKVLPENVTSHDQADSEGWWSRLPPIQALTLNSVVAKVEHVLDGNNVYVKAIGYAFSHTRITRVEVSGDGGKVWTSARITYQEGKWSWALWEGDVGVDIGAQFSEGGEKQVTVLSRAYDDSGDAQNIECPWNLRGVGFSGAGEGSAVISTR
ncbi:molybdopterin binding oxidoreductase [Leucogyrophana mollusca]|uniref:Molybdopterin binding oxidoreductase n=1 Tax=Leucogyrophana mollusca TaxID=85980 RepID=A0ACB8BTZ1_9AGAM|nr:molybdopterin binding oxidoreductase [Leucogyrophana mollusca]